VLLVQRWILARLRNRRFFSLGELNAAIGLLLVDLNQRPFKKLPGCRRSAFEALDAPVLRPLPATRYVIGRWKAAKVNVDYHVEFEGYYYSVPHRLVGAKIDVRAASAQRHQQPQVRPGHRRLASPRPQFADHRPHR